MKLFFSECDFFGTIIPLNIFIRKLFSRKPFTKDWCIIELYYTESYESGQLVKTENYFQRFVINNKVFYRIVRIGTVFPITVKTEYCL